MSIQDEIFDIDIYIDTLSGENSSIRKHWQTFRDWACNMEVELDACHKEIQAQRTTILTMMATSGVRIGYKLLKKRKDGTLGPLFINARQRIPIGQWLPAEDHPKKGYAHRPGWHVMQHQDAPHLSKKNRVWAKVAVLDYETLTRPNVQGGEWLLAKNMMVLEELS